MSKSRKPVAREPINQKQSAMRALRSSTKGVSWGTTIAVVVVVVFAVAVGAGVYFGQRPSEVIVPPNAAAEGVVVGQPGAPVTIDLYEDFLCPACQQFDQQTGPTIKELIESGKAKVVYHPLAFLDRFSSTKYSSRSSAASGCAAAAGVFPRYAELLYTHQPPEGGAGLPAERLIELGTQAGATGEDFASCVREQRYAGWTANLTEAASRRGVNGTPTVFVNGERLPQPTPQALRQAVDNAA